LDVPYDPEALVRAVAALPTSGNVQLIAWQPFGKPKRSGPDWTSVSAEYFQGAPDAVPESLGELLGELKPSRDARTNPVPLDAIRRAQARMIYLDHIGPFSHGGKRDITNHMLAPLRILAAAEASIDSYGRKSLWTEFERLVKAIEEEGNAFWGPNLAAACARLNGLLPENGKAARKPTEVVASCESIMRLLTEIRVASGVPVRADSSGSGGKAPEPLSISGENEKRQYRVLVIDDHAETWKPVLEHALTQALQEAPLTGAGATVDFSNDGKKVQVNPSGRELMEVISSYDLVLLDVYLSGDTNGLDVLEVIRKTYHQLPVVLWTSSMDAENPARASQSNGYLFKKTATMGDLETAFKYWLPIGLNRRTTTLPDPFFDHVIQDFESRELAQDMTEWCLKQMDSFHALDGTFFRYFTDHGGRHFVKVLNILRRLLEPFAAMKESPILPADEEDREKWFVLLYLAVITHELGMFPMRVHGAPELFSEVGQNYLNDVRTLHGLRAMVMLADDTNSYWPDDEGKKLAERLTQLRFGEELRKMLAVVVGYHPRYFKSLKPGTFLKWPNKKDERPKPAKSSSPYLTAQPNLFVKTLEVLHQAFSDPTTREHLRKLCALFRFADALDITASRNPAQFLCSASSLPITQYIENLKRQLCTELTIDNGQVTISLVADQPESKEVLTALEMTGELDKKYKETEIEALRQPWKEKSDFPLALHNRMNTWLKNFWGIIAGARVAYEYAQGLKEQGLISGQGNGYASTEKGRRLAAVLGALCVIGDLQSEYEAISDAGLHEKITLGTVNWKGYNTDHLSILEKVLKGYEDSSA
jgi:CheY-like chemotaxis protein